MVESFKNTYERKKKNTFCSFVRVKGKIRYERGLYRLGKWVGLEGNDDIRIRERVALVMLPFSGELTCKE